MNQSSQRNVQPSTMFPLRPRSEGAHPTGPSQLLMGGRGTLNANEIAACHGHCIALPQPRRPSSVFPPRCYLALQTAQPFAPPLPRSADFLPSFQDGRAAHSFKSETVSPEGEKHFLPSMDKTVDILMTPWPDMQPGSVYCKPKETHQACSQKAQDATNGIVECV